MVDGLVDNNINAIIESADGALWFGTGSGISRYEQEICATITIDNGLVDDRVEAIIESSDSALWFGTWDGVNRYYQGQWRTFKNEIGTSMASRDVEKILEASDGSIWFDKGYGVSRYYRGTWINFSNAACISVNTITESSDGAMWFGTDSKGVSCYKVGTWTTFTEANGLVSDWIRAICESSDSSLWIGTLFGVSRYKKGKWTTFTTDNGLIDNCVNSIIESNDGALWFGTAKGVSRYYQGQWSSFITEIGLPVDNSVEKLFVFSDGAIWLIKSGAPGSNEYGGVSRYYKGSWTNFYLKDGLADNIVNTIIKSSDGALWFATEAGVSRYHQGNWSTFNIANGLLSNRVNTIIVTIDGTLWVGTFWGVNKLRPDKTPPFSVIDFGPKSEEIIGTATHMFGFHGKDYRTKLEQIRYSYRVVNLSSFPDSFDWSLFSSNTSIQTHDLKNGSYRFEVRAIDEWGNIDPSPATRTFTVDITPPTTVIEYPTQNDTLSQIIPIIGYAYDDSPIRVFDYYGISYGKRTTEADVIEWDTLVYQNKEEIRKDTLAIWNTSGLRGTYQLKLFAHDTLGHQNQDIVTIHLVDATQEIKSRTGGSVADLNNNIEIYFPPNSFDKDIEVKVSRVMDLNPQQINNELHRYAGLAYNVMPKNITARKNGTLTLTYADSNLIDVADERKLSIFRYNEQKNDWDLIGGTVQTEHNKISAPIKQLGRYGLFENLQEGAKHSLADIDCQPRVFSPRGGGYSTETNISFYLGKEYNVTIKIFNLASRLVKTLCDNQIMSSGSNSITWDGKDGEGNYCVSGLYVVMIQAEDKEATKTVMVLNK